MGHLRTIAVFVIVVAAVGCASPPVTITTARTAVAADADDHLFPTGEGTFYCKITDEVIDGADVAAHLKHLATLKRARHGHFAGSPTHTASEHATHSPSATGTGHGPERVSLVGRDDHANHECRPTTDEQAAADELLADTRAAIAKYDRGSKAMFAGYHPVTGPARNRSQHYVNDRYRRDTDVLLAEHVESLVFGWTRHHGVVPLGALYIMPKAGMHGPEIGGCLTRWHIHQAGDGEFGSGAELPEMLHVWTVDMPGGPFAAEPDADYIRDL